LTSSFRPHYGPGVDSASNRNEYHEYFLGSKGGQCVGLTTLPPSCADCLQIWEPQPPGSLRACPDLLTCFKYSGVTSVLENNSASFQSSSRKLKENKSFNIKDEGFEEY